MIIHGVGFLYVKFHIAFKNMKTNGDLCVRERTQIKPLDSNMSFM